MKHYFTLLVAFICSMAIYAQTPAQEMTTSTFKGEAKIKVSILTLTAKNQTAEFTINASNNKAVNIKISDATVTPLNNTINVKNVKAENIEVTKSGSTYSLSDKTFNVTITSGENSKDDVTAKFTASSIDINGKKATLTMNLTNLPNAMIEKVGSSLDVNYTFELDTYTPSAINAVTVDEQKADRKYMKDGKVVIMNNGVEYNVNGTMLK